MDMVQRQHVQDVVPSGPLPGRDQGFGLCCNVGVRGDDSLGATGCAAGVEHHRPTLGCHLRQATRHVRSQLITVQQLQPAVLSHALESVRELGMCNQQAGLGVVDDVLDFPNWVLNRQWNRHSTSTPHSPLGTDIVETGGHQKGHAGFAQIVPSSQQTRSGRRGRVQQILVGPGTVLGHDGRRLEMVCGRLNQSQVITPVTAS